MSSDAPSCNHQFRFLTTLNHGSRFTPCTLCGVIRDEIMVRHYEKQFTGFMSIFKKPKSLPHFHVHDEHNECVIHNPAKKDIICGDMLI